MKSIHNVKLYLAMAGLGAALASGGCATMAPQPVIGHNDPAVDVAVVQKAVDQGGTVLLKGEFDFGDKGNVTITKDVSVIGEADDHGSPRTTIKGGETTLRSVRPEAPTTPGPKITIEHIHFDGASRMPIQIAYASGVTITGNRITRVRPVPQVSKAWGPFSMQQGMMLGTSGAYQPDAVTGTVTISDNEIDVTNDTPKTTMGQAIWLIHTTGVIANIARNTIRNASRNGMEVIDNFRGSDGKGQITIHDNDIETPVEGLPIPSPSTPNGIVFGYFLDPAAASDPNRAIQHVFVHNTVRTRGQTSMGIAVIMNEARVTDNHVTMEGPRALGIFVAGSHNYIGQNLIKGAGATGVAFAPFPQIVTTHNELVRNEFGELKSTGADVVFRKGADNNIATGSNGSVSDLGSGNQTQGLKPVAAAPVK
jgi:hypothetical protein